MCNTLAHSVYGIIIYALRRSSWHIIRAHLLQTAERAHEKCSAQLHIVYTTFLPVTSTLQVLYLDLTIDNRLLPV